MTDGDQFFLGMTDDAVIQGKAIRMQGFDAGGHGDGVRVSQRPAKSRLGGLKNRADPRLLLKLEPV